MGSLFEQFAAGFGCCISGLHCEYFDALLHDYYIVLSQNINLVLYSPFGELSPSTD